MHHVLHTAATLESNGYYGDYKDDTEKLCRALAEGFAFQEEVMQARNASTGKPSAHLPPGAFVTFMQNHDQIGNRAFGERINATPCPSYFIPLFKADKYDPHVWADLFVKAGARYVTVTEKDSLVKDGIQAPVDEDSELRLVKPGWYTIVVAQ